MNQPRNFKPPKNYLSQNPQTTILNPEPEPYLLRLMIYNLHYLKDPKLWELWDIPYYGSCRISTMNRMILQVPTSDPVGSSLDSRLRWQLTLFIAACFCALKQGHYFGELPL